MRTVIILGLFLSACGAPLSDRPESTVPSDAVETTVPPAVSEAGSWVLTNGSVDGVAVPLVEGYRITLTFDGTQLGGTAACNSYGGTFTTTGAAVAVEEIMVTAMACEPPEVMVSEEAYLAGLQRVTAIERSGQMLELSGDGVAFTYAALAPAPRAELIGTRWDLESLLTGDSAQSAVLATLELFPDGTLTGTTGCRSLEGRYIVSGDEVLFTELSADGDCPAAVQSQDSHVVSVLGDGFIAEVDGDQLILTSRGSEGLVYRRG